MSIRTFNQPELHTRILRESGNAESVTAYQKVLELAGNVRAKCGRALLVGGSVRDLAAGYPSKDFDVEVYGLEPDIIEETVRKIGKVSDVGRAFGILKITLKDGLGIDVSLPRSDSKTGTGHNGFSVKADPYMNIEDAARRRDFTMNALAADPLTGELFDFFGGLEDIKNRILRVTDPGRFGDDPLRVLRAMQFVGRFEMEADEKSTKIMRAMLPGIKELPKERVGEEWKKLLLKSGRPSRGLVFGMNLGLFDALHPELPPLAETAQDPEWHPEGNVWNHTLMTVDEAAKIVQKEHLKPGDALVILLGALCHDLGKPAVTKTTEGHIRSRGHEKAGKEPAEKFLTAIGADRLTKEKTVNLVADHLTPTLFYIEEVIRGNKISDGAVRRLAQRLYPATIRELVMVSEADHLGRGPFDCETERNLLLPSGCFPVSAWLLERAEKLNVMSSRPADLTRGRDWLKRGFEPGKHIGELIRLSNDLRDGKNFSREMVFDITGTAKNPDKVIEALRAVLC